MRDLKNLKPVYDVRSIVENVGGCVLMLMLFSLMGWMFVEIPPTPRPYLSYQDKGTIFIYSQQAMADYTNTLNERMIEQSRSGN